ncbi:hypothetical protein D9756_011400 [Leucocoprinus leucothites]|uniref:Uncharacterized protein n=1 Tax=Leucocoprinus leucothites TaxID=201217 RepID=A0A8H5CR95_9AGAR|nr:hypothetical protein D9756_011400 [Leucoagaricus leucothites]
MASYVGPRWQTATNAAPPFSGAPPIPAGANIPAHQWNAGNWIPNPNFNPQAARPSGPVWMPAPAWGPNMFPQYRPPQQQQQQQHFNPYKRQPRQPSAEYLATKLSDNPLGLTNMIPAEELARREREQQEKEPVEADASTPWLWNPRDLDADESDEEGGPTKNQPAQRNATNNIYAAPTQNQTPERPPSVQAPESFTSKGALQPTFSINIVRTPEHYTSPSPSCASHRATAPAQIYASPARSLSRGSSVDTVTTQMSHLSTNSLTRHNSMPVTSTTSNSVTGQQQFTEEPTPFDVLSPLVFPMTPKPSSSRSTQGLGRHASVPAIATNLDTIPETGSSATSSSRAHTPGPGNSSRRNSHQDDQQQQQQQHHSHSRSRPSSRQASRSNSTSPYSVPHSNEPSPISPTYPHSSGHSPHNAHFPYSQPPSKNPLPPPPAELNPIFSQIPNSSVPNTNANHTSPGTSSGSYIYYQPPPHTHTRTKSHSQQAPPPQTAGTAIIHANGSSTLTTLTSSPPRSPPNHPERALSPAHLFPHSHHLQYHHQTQNTPDRPSTTTPTSKPKRKISYPSHINGSSSAASPSSPSPPKSSPSKSSKGHKRRKGFWNRRGDHVTAEGYIVYAPGHLVYPKDLDDYPDGKDGGYKNENGMKAMWAPRPEFSPPGGYESIIEWMEV